MGTLKFREGKWRNLKEEATLKGQAQIWAIQLQLGGVRGAKMRRGALYTRHLPLRLPNHLMPNRHLNQFLVTGKYPLPREHRKASDPQEDLHLHLPIRWRNALRADPLLNEAPQNPGPVALG